MADRIQFAADGITEARASVIIPSSSVVYVEADIAWLPSSIFYWFDSNETASPPFVILDAGFSPPVMDEIELANVSDPYDYWSTVFAFVPAHTEAETFHVVKYKYDETGSSISLEVDGDLGVASGGTDPVTRVSFGCLRNPSTGGPGGGTVYMRTLKIGTTLGGDDLFSFDASVDSLAAFDQLSGDVTLVSSFAPPPTPPANDNFAAATELEWSRGLISATNLFATEQVPDPIVTDHGSGPNTIWFKFTPTQDCDFSLECKRLNNVGPIIDLKMAVYTGASLDTLVEEAFDNNSGVGSFPALTLSVLQGVEYHVCIVGATAFTMGAFDLDYIADIPPSNDDFANATLLGQSGAFVDDNRFATSQVDDPLVDDGYGEQTIWYKVTPAATGVLHIRVGDAPASESLDMVMGIYTGGALGSLVQVAFDDDSGPGTFPRIDLNVTAGVEYHIEVAGYGSDDPFYNGRFLLSWAVVASTVQVGRFFHGYPWKFVFTDLDGVIVSQPDDILTGRRIAKVLGQATVIEGAVWPDNRQANQIAPDGYPRIAQSIRLVYAFRRDGPEEEPWTPREAGILMSPEDEADADISLTHFTAYDPRKLLEARPCMRPGGGMPGEEGLRYFSPGNEIALALLKETIDIEGTVHIDAGVAYGGTAFYGGTIETTEQLAFRVDYGDMVADAWNALTETGTLDIVLTAIFDPINRPGYTHELSIYQMAGTERPKAVFAWGMLNRSVSNIDRVHDGTPGAFFNKVQYHAGQGGPPVPLTGPLENALSIADFGSYWADQFFPSQTSRDETAGAVLAMAREALVMAKQGKRAMTLRLTPERAPILYSGYTMGDRVPIYAPNSLRVTAAGYQRIHGIPIEISDDGLENIPALLCTPDFREDTT